MKWEWKKRYIIQDREAGNNIDEFDTLEEAKKTLEEYEKQDKKDGIYEENFYAIYDQQTQELVD